MSGKESKRSKGRRGLYSHSKCVPTIAASVDGASDGLPLKSFQSLGVDLKMNGSDRTNEFITTLDSPCDGVERITELMDAPAELDISSHTLSRATNPYLDRCMYCNTPHTLSPDGDDGLELIDLQLADNGSVNSCLDSRSFSSLKLEIWTCAACRKAARCFQSFLEVNLPQSPDGLPSLRDKTYVEPLPCARYREECNSMEKEVTELHENWIELHYLVQSLYSTEESDLDEEHGNRLKYLVDKLCSQDPHQLFLRLESQIRDIMVEIKTSLLTKLKEDGISTPQLALDFTRSLLSRYDLLTEKAHLFAQYIGGLTEHLQRFKVTWELLNKHLFHSIAHSDSVISSSGPTILELLRHGSGQNDNLIEDPFSSAHTHLLKFQEEMLEVITVWRDCQQLIETYCQEEVKNTQKQVSIKAMNFVSHQRQLLKKQLMKEPLMHEALSETMRNLMSGHKSSAERVLCHNCMRERCTCDECTITHMITCGIIDTSKGEASSLPNSFSFSLDHAHNVISMTPPSLSSTTSSSGSVSPINIEEKFTFYECETVLKEEFQNSLHGCDSKDVQVLDINTVPNNYSISSADVLDEDDDDVDDDDDNEEEDDPEEDSLLDNQDMINGLPHPFEIPVCELKDADVLWEAVQQHHHEQLLQQQQQLIIGSQHSCSHCKPVKNGRQCPFQARLEPELPGHFEMEMLKSDLLPGQVGDCDVGTSNNVEGEISDRGSGDGGGGGGGGSGIISPGVCATCQCHACLKQSGHVISASLPFQIPVSSPPAELHLYPHIHGLSQQHQQHYLLDLPPPLLPAMKFPVQLEQDHLTYTYSDWENPMQSGPGSLTAQHHHQHHRLSALSSEHLPPSSLVTSASPFTFDLASHLATHIMHTSTTNTSVFKSVAGKPLASSAVPPSINSVSQMASEGSSVDPSKPLDFTAHSRASQSCLNLNNSLFSSHSCSCLPFISAPLPPVPGAPVICEAPGSPGTCGGPSCSRPPPLGGNVSSSKWERSQHCRKFSGNNKSEVGIQDQYIAGGPPLAGGIVGSPTPTSQAALKNINFNPKSNTQPSSHFPPPKPAALTHSPASVPTTTIASVPVTQSAPIVSLACSNSSLTPVNNVSVGTSTPCNDPECDAHQRDENCDSIDDSCSEKSSSTSSNQKEGKYCDCCYCEFFGHNNAQVAKISTNYIEMKDRLRKKLKKRQSENKKLDAPKNGFIQEDSRSELDLLEKKGLDGLLSFINGTDKDSQGKPKDKDVTAKAAKRARQKQKKLEERARQAKSTSPPDKHSQPDLAASLGQLIFKQTSGLATQASKCDPRQNMSKFETKKSQGLPWTKNEMKDLELRNASSSCITKQEIRSSLIIESARPSISMPPMNMNKSAVTQQKVSGSSTEQSQGMVQLLQSLQQQQQQQENKMKPANTASVNISKSIQVSKATSRQTVNTASTVKLESSGSKVNGVAKDEQNHCHKTLQQQLPHPQQQLPPPQSQQQKQKQQVKVMNGKLPVSSQPAAGNTNHLTSNGCSNGFNKITEQESHIQSNGKLSKAAAVSARANTPVKLITVNSEPCKISAVDSPSVGNGGSTPQSPSNGTKTTAEQVKANGRTKKSKKKNRNGHVTGLDEVFLPKSHSELDGDVDDFERELEEFKRFCFEPAEPKERRKIAVNVNLKDIFKKKTSMV